jgi:hypothetical protein
MLWFFLMLALNFGISWHNARTVGRYWSEAKAVGGSLRRNAIAGYVMAICGFTMVYSCLLLLVLPEVLPLFTDLTSADLYDTTELAGDLLYVLIGLFIIPSGFAIWFRNLSSLWERRTLGEGLRLGWNSYAQIRNTVNYIRHAPSALGRISKALFGGRGRKKNGAVLVLAIFVVILAVCGGYFTAAAILKSADEKYDAFAAMEARAEAHAG